MEETAKQGHWQWQEAGTSWKGVGIYHLTLTLPSREPLLGTLVIPNNDPAQARVEPSELGRAVLDCLRSVPVFHSEIQILQYCLMPDHLHSIWYVRRPMEKSIRYVAQAFWRGAKKAGRAYSFLHDGGSCLPGSTMNERAQMALSFIAPAGSRESPLSSLAPSGSREPPLSSLPPVWKPGEPPFVPCPGWKPGKPPLRPPWH